MKKKSAIIAAFAMACIGTAVTACAASDISVTVNGAEVEFDAKPFIENERTLVPIRAITEAMSCDVSWNGYTQRAVIENAESMVAIDIGSNAITVKNKADNTSKTVEIDTPAGIYDERTYVPLRAVSEAFGANVKWNDESKTAVITYGTEPTDEEKTVYAAQRKAYEAIDALMADASSEKDMVKAIHDYLVLHMDYDVDYVYANDGKSAAELAFEDGKGSCWVYSEAFELLCDHYGIECMCVIGSANGVTHENEERVWSEHEWNIVKVDGRYCHIDVAWDDPIGEAEDYIRYKYFLLSDDELAAFDRHSWDRSSVP